MRKKEDQTLNSGGTDVSKVFVDSMSTISKHYVSKAGYDKTIQAQILSCVDETIGLYRCRYQDSVWDAFSNNIDITYPNGSYVYVLIPGNDFRNAKTILGSTKKLGINYISQIDGDLAYDIIGTNCVMSSSIYYLNSSNQNYSYAIYKADQVSDLQLDVEALERYIKKSSSLIIEAVFKTSLPSDRQYNGSYGIIYNLRFKDNATGEDVIRSYILNEDSMIDNPYRLINGTRQYEIFEVDGNNFVRVESIEIFNRDFPGANEENEGRLSSGDIEISKIGLTGAVKFSSNELEGVAISLLTPQGDFFKESALPSDVLTIIAEVRIKGKIASSAQDISFYWGRQDIRVSTENKYYNKYLGRGWYCLNTQNIISEQDGIAEWVPAENTFIIRCEEAVAKHNKIKVAILYNGQVFTKQIDIENKSLNVSDITIETDNGILKYFNDIGHPNLTCKVDGQENSQDYTYAWAYVSNTGNFISLPETEDQNVAYTEALIQLNQLKQGIANGTSFPNANKENLIIYENAVKAFDSVQRVEKNKIFNVQIRDIDNFGTFKCSVYNKNDICMGTGSITLTNEIGNTDSYTLIMNNGSVVFQYNEEGIAPNSKKLTSPQILQGLSFTIYDKQGYAIDQELIKSANNCKIRWIVPIEDTMLKDNPDENGGRDGTDDNLRYAYYEDITNLSYDIAQTYNVNKQNNQIQLEVNYKGTNLVARTNFSFIKQGDPGTNGTEYVVKLIPNTTMNMPPQFPVITKVGEGTEYYINYGIGNNNSSTVINLKGSLLTDNYQFFKAQLWRGGDLIWEGFDAGTVSQLDGETKPSLIEWSILQNKYGKNNLGEIIYDESDFEIADALTGKISYKGNNLDDNNTFSFPKANIIKCRIVWDGKTYFGTIPITTAWVTNGSYQVGLKDNTGFRYVAYTSDGVLPSYDNSNLFEFTCQERMANNIWEDVSQIKGSHKINYESTYCGNIVKNINGQNITYQDAHLLKASYRLGSQKDNQWGYRPITRYDGECVNVAVLCTYKKQTGQPIGRINVPIHFYLNKFGLDHLNDWDGNSIQISEEDGYILAPQVGAGSKDENNRFTGVLMGEVKNPSKNISNTGLLGYSDGDRTFFLNSANGSAIFGKAGKGQLIIDPNQNKALLYSSNFWKASAYDPVTGLPEISASNESGDSGLLIDLTTPEIRFGNGKFKVGADGKVIATEASISGNIVANSLTVGAKNATISGWKGSDATLEAILNDLSVAAQTTSKIETWVSNENPAIWPSTQNEAHKGDLWFYNGTTELSSVQDSQGDNIYPSKTYIYTINGTWAKYKNPSQVLFDLADGKAEIYFNNSAPDLNNVNINDIWVNNSNNNISICVMEGNIKKWKEIKNYENAINNLSNSLTAQIDGKIQTFVSNVDPSESWYDQTNNIDTRKQHNGDLWYYTGITPFNTNGSWVQPSRTYQYNVITNQSGNITSTSWTSVDSDQFSSLFDLADGKSTVYQGTNHNAMLEAPSHGDIYVQINEVSGQGGTTKTEKKIFVYKVKTPSNKGWVQVDNYKNDIEDLQSAIANLGGVIQTFVVNTNPAANWSTTSEKDQHIGDLWYYNGSSTITIDNVQIYPSKVYKYTNLYKWEEYNGTDVSSYLFRASGGSKNIFYTDAISESNYPAGGNDGDILIHSRGWVYRWDTNSSPSKWVQIQVLSDKYGIVMRKGGLISVEGNAQYGTAEINSFDEWTDERAEAYVKDEDYVLYDERIFKCRQTHIPSQVSGYGTPPTRASNQDSNTYWILEDRNIFAIPVSGSVVGTNLVMTGTVFSTAGRIGGWAIENDRLYQGTQGQEQSVHLTPRGSQTSIFYNKRNDWVITAGDGFGVTNKGFVYASKGYIGNLEIKNDYIGSPWQPDREYGTGNRVHSDGEIYEYIAEESSSGHQVSEEEYWEKTNPFIGQIGYKAGADGSSDTRGIYLGTEDSYFIATESGARITCGSLSPSDVPSIYVTNNSAEMHRNSTNKISITKHDYPGTGGSTIHGSRIRIQNGPRFIDMNDQGQDIYITALGNSTNASGMGVPPGIEIGLNRDNPLIVIDSQGAIDVASNCRIVSENAQWIVNNVGYSDSDGLYFQSGGKTVKVKDLDKWTGVLTNYIAYNSASGLYFVSSGKTVKVTDLDSCISKVNTLSDHIGYNNNDGLYFVSKGQTINPITLNSSVTSASSLASTANSTANKAWWSVGQSPGNDAHTRIDNCVLAIKRIDAILNYCYKAITNGYNIQYAYSPSSASSGLWS